jgi:hypothetical protein
MTSRRNFLLSAGAATVGGLVSGSLARASTGYWVAQAGGPETPNLRLGFHTDCGVCPPDHRQGEGLFRQARHDRCRGVEAGQLAGSP